MNSQTSDHPRRCGRCGARLPASVAEANCPRCLLAFGIDGFADDRSDPNPDADPGAAGDESRGGDRDGVDFGDYILLDEIGRGGMGVVFRARQKSLNRWVAIKLILFGRWATDEQRRRFQSEAAAAAALDHPHIVPIYEVGEHEGQPFYSMKLIAGESLAGRPVDRSVAAIRRRVRIVVLIARSVHYAHQRGVLHRDLKPTNILLDADGRPHLADFGLAKMLEVDSMATRTGALLGTPHYMAPEQADDRPQDLTTAVDVYGLGAILYELITGRPPFTGNTALSVLDQVRHKDPIRPAQLNPDVDRNLESVCLKCLRKEPDRRYGSAMELADDLDRWLEGRPIRARPVAPSERLQLWARRRPRIAALVASILVLIVGTALISTFMAVNLSRARDEARRLSEENRLKVVELNRTAAIQRVDQGEFLLALPWFEAAIAASKDSDTARNIVALRNSLFRWSPRLEQVWFHSAPVSHVRFSGDGRFIAVGFGDGRVHLRDASDGRLVCPELNHHREDDAADGGPDLSRALSALEFSPDNALLVSAAGREARMWKVPGGQPAFEPLIHPDRVLHATFNHAGTILATAGADNAARFWRSENGEPVCEPLRHVWGAIRYIAFRGDDGRLATFGADSNVRLWTWPEGRLEGQAYVHQGGTMGGFLNDGRWLLGCGDNNHFWLRDIDSIHPETFTRSQADALTFALIHPDRVRPGRWRPGDHRPAPVGPALGCPHRTSPDAAPGIRRLDNRSGPGRNRG